MKSIKANIGDRVWFANGKEDLAFGTVILSFLHYKRALRDRSGNRYRSYLFGA